MDEVNRNRLEEFRQLRQEVRHSKKALGSGFGNSVFLLGGMSKARGAGFAIPHFIKPDRVSSIKKLKLGAGLGML